MKFIKTLGIFLIVLVILVLINRWYLGGFVRLEAKEQNMGPYTIAYVNFVGNYGKVGPSMTKVYEILSGAGIISYTGVGIYYDDPAVISGELLRSDIGAIIDPQDTNKLFDNKDIQIKTLTAGNKIVVEFPLKNTFSSMIGPMRVYPVMTKYMEENGYTNEIPMIELYDMQAKKIYYIAEVKK
ncbi:MAG TPA: GyrI-like domain-containing protein [Candidatus Absconditabacterales bacterium]|nr:GyrI-like domain-containing protein [Candidatus Absconditabacterales bacterium]